MEKLAFGTSGFPSSAPKKDPIAALQIIREIGLDCMELEFAHGVRIRDETAQDLARAARRQGVILTAHAPYYINLNAKEQDKIDSSINRLLQTARLAGLCGAFSMTFHAAFYMKDDPKSVFDIVKRYLHQITERLRAEGNMIHLRPELTGRKSQFGTLEELCELSQEIGSVYPCLDFSHNQSRTDGLGNSYKEFATIFERYKEELGKNALSEMHIHVAGVQYGAKGEIRHLSLADSKFNYKEFLKACYDFGLKGVVVCESPEQERDALLLKSTYEKVALSPKVKPTLTLTENLQLKVKPTAKKPASKTKPAVKKTPAKKPASVIHS
jgi:deoxyribonuclease-4